MTTLTNCRLRTTALALALTLACLSGCGNKTDGMVATQVAAKVGSEEITVHQVNQMLGRAKTEGASPQEVQSLSRDILEKLIDQQLAVEQATDAKLHRSPEVVAQIEAARSDILTRAYLQQLATALPPPTQQEAEKYFADHPLLFTQRRVFSVQEVVMPAASGVLEPLRNFAASGRPAEDVADWLQGKNIRFNGGNASRPAEQIPLDALAHVSALKDGQATVLESADTITYLRLLSSQTVPVSEAAALPRIKVFLTNQRANEAIAAQMKKLRSETQIAYMGEFAHTTPASATAAPATAAATATPAATAPTTIEKGVAGLK